MKKSLTITLTPSGDNQIHLSVNGNMFCTYTLFSGEDQAKVMTRAAIKLREEIYSLSCNEVYHTHTFIP